jgi:Domain of unknown function (DUF222)/HNH endonuclease
MDSNTSSRMNLGLSVNADGLPAGGPHVDAVPVGLEALAAAIAELAAGDPDSLGDALLAEQVLAVRRLADQLEGAWLRLLAAVDARGAAGAEAGTQAASTASWLRAVLRMGPGAAGQRVRTARALYRGPLAATARALAAGQVSYQHAAVLADATSDLPPTKVGEAEPVLVDAAGRLDPPRLRRLATHLREVVDPDGAEVRARARLDRRGLWLSATFDGLMAVDGLLDGEAGEAVHAALMPLARPAGPEDERTGAQRRADALGELARQALQAGRLPQGGGLRPQVTVTVELASLLAGPCELGGVGGVGGWGGWLADEAARRLACDATVARAVVRRHASHGSATHDGALDGGNGHGTTHALDATHGGAYAGAAGSNPQDGELAARLREVVALLPPPLGAPAELLDLGRATRVVSAALRRALAVRDGGCAAAGCDRPPSWTDAHHLVHWLHGGPTRLDNLLLLCRVHHQAVHEGGWRLGRDSATGQATLTPPARRGHSP